MSSPVQLLGISNAIVDVLSHVEDDFLSRIDAVKHSMTLIDQERAAKVYGMMGPATEMSGGSVANTVASFAILGGTGAYIGRVADDQLGKIFVHDMQSLGVDVRLTPSPDGSPTARSFVLITPDGERTMQTYLGACMELSVDDVTENTVGKPEITLLEGYIWDTPEGRAAGETAIRLAETNGTKAALSLSDAMCVDRHRDAFLDAVTGHVDIVFANEAEITSLFKVNSLAEAADKAAKIDALFVLTRSEDGSVIVRGDERVFQRAHDVERVVDATGAGDAYSAAFLRGLTTGRSLTECADYASACATYVIQQVGARVDRGFLET